MLVLDLSEKAAVQLTATGAEFLSGAEDTSYEMRGDLCVMTLGRLIYIFGGNHCVGGSKDFVDNKIMPSRETSFTTDDVVWVKFTREGLAKLLWSIQSSGSVPEFSVHDDYHIFSFSVFMFMFGGYSEVLLNPQKYFSDLKMWPK